VILPGQIYRDLSARMERRLLRVADMAGDYAILYRVDETGAAFGPMKRVQAERLADTHYYRPEVTCR
jgi:hypothetical protein